MLLFEGLRGARKMHGKRMLWLAAPICLLVLVFLFAGDFLALNQAPVGSDVIVVLGGGPPARVAKAVELYRKGYAPRLLMSGGAVYSPWQDQAQHMRQQAVERGVPSDRILLDNRSLTTFQNALYTLQVMKAHHLTSAIVVSSTFHMRRAWADFSYVFFGQGIRLVYCSSPYAGFHPATWWTTAAGRAITLSEYAKIAYTVIVDMVLRLRHSPTT